MGFRLKFLLLLPLLWAQFAFAGVEQISEKEFAALAQELAPKVNLFREGWKKNPDAEFYGGTTRDYLYWLKGQFQHVHNAEQAKAELAQLRALTTIDVRDFIIGDSDVDIISAAAGSLDAKQFGVRKIDFQSPDILDPSTELGKNEILQGYIPAEKIRLGQNGFHPTGLGNGVKEIYDGKLSVHFASAEDFAKSTYAKEGINHPILLALRFIRVQAINYFRTHGAGLPDKEILFKDIDSQSALMVRSVIEKATQNGELDSFLAQPRFTSWLNGAIQKSFRSYTNPTAALELMKQFGVDRLALRYSDKIESLNQYVFTKYRDPHAIRQALAQNGVKESEFYRAPSEFFPDGRLYHGTRTDEAFRGILLQGVLPSEGGSGGEGLYGVAEPNKKFSEEWAGDKNRLLSFDVKPDAKIVDITQGEGERIFARSRLDFEEFAEKFGVDILSYPYNPQAFVVKNSAALEKPQGVYRKIMPLGELIKAAKSINSAEELANLVSANGLSTDELRAVWNASSVKMASVAEYLEQSPFDDTKKHVLEMPFLQSQPEIQGVIKKWLVLPENDTRYSTTKDMLENITNPTVEQIKFIDSLFKEEAIMKNWYVQIGLLGIPLADRAQLTPNATAHVLSSLSDPTGAASAHLTFIAKAKLSPAEQESLWKIYQSEGMKSARSANARIDLAAGLLKNNKNIELVKADLLAPAEDNFYPAGSKATLLIEHFPQDRKVAETFSAFLHTYLDVIFNTRSTDSFDALNKNYSLLKHQEVLKPFLFKSLSSEKEEMRTFAKGMLGSGGLTDDEWILFLQKVTPEDLAPNHLNQLLKHTARSPELSRALLEAYKNVPYDLSVRSRLREVIQADANPAIAQSYVRDALLNASYKTERAARAMHLVAEAPYLAHSPEVEDAMLTFLDKSGKHFFRHKIGIKKQFLDYLPVENPLTASRLQKLLAEGKMGQFNYDPEALISLAERMQSISPEFSSYIQMSLKDSESKLLPAFLKSYNARFEVVSHKVMESCPASFAAIGGSP